MRLDVNHYYCNCLVLHYEKLDHIPSSCIVLMVHVVKVVSINIDAGASIAEMESKTDSQPRHGHVLMLQSQEMNSTAQYSF